MSDLHVCMFAFAAASSQLNPHRMPDSEALWLLQILSGAALPGRASHPQHAPHLPRCVAKAATPTRVLTALLTLRLLVVGGDVGDCYA
eukprot:scaffold76391_cov60-Phaeocystis_antarctica.AAC.3